MTQLSISLPEDLTTYIQTQISSGSYPTPSQYIQALIKQDQSRRTHLETLALEGLNSGPATPMTQDDWDTIRAAVRQNLTQGNIDA